MTALRLASYNVEWFTELFNDDGSFVNDSSASVRHGATKAQQFDAIGAVMCALDADGIMVIEAPDTNKRRSTVAALTRFAEHFGLRARQAVIGYISDTEQEISFMFDPDRMKVIHDPMASGDVAPRFDRAVQVLLDGKIEQIRFSKPPLELQVEVPNFGQMRLIGVHAKSKAAHDAHGREEFIRISIQNRRKQLAECFWLRARIDQILTQNMPLIVIGDLNDGPGLDEYEHIFGYSGVEVVTGQSDPTKTLLLDPHVATKSGATTSRFWLNDQNAFFEALIDFIMVSPDLVRTEPVWRIWHPIKDAEIAQNSDLTQALLTASDHFPVTIDIPLPSAV